MARKKSQYIGRTDRLTDDDLMLSFDVDNAYFVSEAEGVLYRSDRLKKSERTAAQSRRGISARHRMLSKKQKYKPVEVHLYHFRDKFRARRAHAHVDVDGVMTVAKERYLADHPEHTEFFKETRKVWHSSEEEPGRHVEKEVDMDCPKNFSFRWGRRFNEEDKPVLGEVHKGFRAECDKVLREIEDGEHPELLSHRAESANRRISSHLSIELD